MSNLTKLHRQIGDGIKTLRMLNERKAFRKCQADGCAETPHWSTLVITATTLDTKLEVYVFCKDHYLAFTGQKAPAIITPSAPKIIQLNR